MFWIHKNRDFVNAMIHTIDTYRAHCGPCDDEDFYVGGISIHRYPYFDMRTHHDTGNKTVAIYFNKGERKSINKAIARWMAWRAKKEMLICEGTIPSVDSIFQPDEDR